MWREGGRWEATAPTPACRERRQPSRPARLQYDFATRAGVSASVPAKRQRVWRRVLRFMPAYARTNAIMALRLMSLCMHAVTTARIGCCRVAGVAAYVQYACATPDTRCPPSCVCGTRAEYLPGKSSGVCGGSMPTR